MRSSPTSASGGMHSRRARSPSQRATRRARLQRRRLGRAQAQRDCGCEVQQLANGFPGVLSGARFHPVPQADQPEQPGRFHEVQMRQRPPPPGQESDQRHQAIRVRDRRAHRDQHVHVGGKSPQTFPRAAVEPGAEVDDADGACDERRPDHPVDAVVMSRTEQRQRPMRRFEREPQNDPDHRATEPRPGFVALSCGPSGFERTGRRACRFRGGRVARVSDCGCDAGGVDGRGVVPDGGASAHQTDRR